MMNKPILFEKKADCCGCGACVSVCPKNAIGMKEDEAGFTFPVIDESLCVNCGLCKRVCAFQNVDETNTPLKTWAAAAKDKDKLKSSASGGVFFTLAESVIKENGCAVGAAFGDKFNVEHIVVQSSEELCRLQGSKYTQSSTEFIFREVKEKLSSGTKVLFSGCPCQVAGLKAYLGKKYDNLLTIDLICHGVPSNKAFRDYIEAFSKKKKVSVRGFTFRDKSMGWGINGSALTDNNISMKIPASDSSYIYYFKSGMIYRENCYTCKYACENRPGDITIGDYWGIEKAHPEFIGKNGINEADGVSVVIANTEKGVKVMEENSGQFDLIESDFGKAANGNAQLRHPTAYSPKREELIKLYTESGWGAVDKRFEKNMGLRRYIDYIKLMIPKGVKRNLKKIT